MPGPMGLVEGIGGAPLLRRLIMSGRGTVYSDPISALSLNPEIVEPTAQALPAELAATPSRVAPDPGLGLGTRFHAVPFHRSISVLPLV